ncbi:MULTISPECIES: tyrosine-type recombinase/integrase [unclassified Shinella]|uniref:tyrosine-type recombinase/integrase n=1 Tax=unclassified Shinella TaxID=2643062 RepID=UPI00234F9A6C|nr:MULTISPECIES: integrase arm-type DNA-binding domain-containing protein [unclassified Shinella]MCO5153917.1 integrase arm-type DNA-binding domain-containing protein [Shinella sp.]MDC7262860.1 integrase arm-type DNA-binding domain-containing protein [Shinella sp. HY16]MDC7269755.1 integrase arm-type DNA-binding domain-containing protein [Shinella sp. YZ44]
MPLTDVFCRNVKPSEKPQKISDGGGLFLLVEPRGSKLWRLAYRFNAKQKTLSLGIYPAVSLKDARDHRDRAKELLARGIDPGEHKKQEKRKKRLEAGNTFETVAREWFDAQKSGWTPGYADRILRRLEADIFKLIGRRPINEIEPPELLDAIRQIERRNAIVLARRLLQVCGQVFRYAVASGLAKRDPSQDIRGALRSAGPKKHRTALKEAELPEYLAALDAYEGDRRTVLALKLVLHTFLRTSEIRFGAWSEFEALGSERALWRIPAERMKARSEHLVPLTSQVESILEELKRLSGNSPYILPAKTKEGVISQNTLIYALYRMGYHSRATVHGFRGTASTILNENGFNRDWIERQLAHAERDGVRAAYNSAEWLPDRRKMLLWWSDHLEMLYRKQS